MKLETKLHRPEVVHSKPSAQQVKKGTEQLQPKDRSVVQDTAEGAGTGPSADWKDQLRKRFQVVGVNADIEKVDIKQSGETTIYLTLRRAGL